MHKKGINGGNDNQYKDEWTDSRDIKISKISKSLSFIRHVNNKEDIRLNYRQRISYKIKNTQ